MMGARDRAQTAKRRGTALRWAGALALSTAIVMFAPASFPDPASAQFQEANIHHSGLLGTKTLALTFDDGPSRFTGELLDILKAHNIKATFFVLGRQAERFPTLLARMRDEGHVIANHSTTHARLGRKYSRNADMLLAEVGDTHEVIAPFLRPGQGLYFRAPYGFWRVSHAETLNADPVLRHYVGPVFWDIGGHTSIDGEGKASASADWDCWRREWTAEECEVGYMREIARKKGGVALFHDVRERTIKMVETMIPVLVADGYRFVTLDQVPAYDQYKTPQDLPSVPVASLEGRQLADNSPRWTWVQ
ncbi:MAG TPA: hypothetical protein DCL54_05440 [Alphaproteobacteria bacterium]|nr:hypothetical protein [Alphaproteobacteria bacterium]HAJ46007.1 hypothetical protein [Alphaproteobacteria bacterium]